MASLRMRSTSRSRMDDQARYGRVGTASMESEEEADFPPSLTRLARQEATSNRLANPKGTRANPQQSRLPQLPSARRPSASSASRTPAVHDDQSWSSVTSATATSNTNGVHEKELATNQARSMLRRKPTGIARVAAPLRSTSHTGTLQDSQSSSVTGSYTAGARGATRAKDVPEKKTFSPGSSFSDAPAGHIYPELDRYRDFEPLPQPRNGLIPDVPYPLATDLPPPTPLFSGASSQSQLSTFSASPSTRWSESPGPGPYSRDTTPTSVSSQSPGLVAPMRLPAGKLRQGSPADSRPPVTRRRAGSISKDGDAFGSDPNGLAAVREALTSSSSNSTVKNDDRQKTSTSSVDLGIRKSPQKLQKQPKTSLSPPKTIRAPAKPITGMLSPVQVRRPSVDNTLSALPSPQQRPGMPSRPSRDGTPDLYSQFGGPMPIIHSNLSTSSVTERRRSGQLQATSLPRTSEYASSPDRLASTRPPTNKIAKAKDLEQPAPIATGQQRSTRTPSPSVPSFRSRFPIFGRKQKASTDDQQPTKADRPSRKGPAAGTGHEGYGRPGAANRRSSSGAPLPRTLGAAASSSESLNSISDTFLRDRLNPVVIAGGEIVENRNNSTELPRTNLPQSRRPSVDTRKSSTTSLTSRDEFRSGLAPSALPRTSTRTRRPSDSSEAESVSMNSTLAFRRSAQRVHSPDKAPVKIPKPIVTRGFASPSIDSVDTTILSDDSFYISQSSMRQGALVPADGPKKLTKKVKSPHKWNIFGRSHGSSSKETKKAAAAALPSPVKAQPSKPVAFYTMMDSSEQEDNDEPRMEDILKEAEVLKTEELMIRAAQNKASASVHPINTEFPPELIPVRKASVDVPIPRAEVQKSSPQPLSQPADQTPALTGQKPKTSRLPQVGRIPKVVTSRPEHTSPKSFSRPFHRLSVQAQVPRNLEKTGNVLAAGDRSPRKTLTPEAICDDATDIECSEDENLPDSTAPADGEFIAFSPRKNSETTTCTSTSSYINHTAITPQPTAPLGEDEIWDEYNDFMGEPPLSATSSLGTPFHLERYDSRLIRKRSAKTAESPTIKFQLSKEFCLPTDTRDSVDNGKAFTASSHYSADMTARINAAFRFGPDAPSTPFSVTEFVSGYSDRNLITQDGNSPAAATSMLDAKEVDDAPWNVENHDSSSENNATAARNSSSSGSRSSQESPLSQVNLRVGSMTVSKWLTFGQVLFSPVRDDLVNVVGSLKRHAILVIDGLGNDDWSFYAAETYPAATFFNLSPRAPIAQEPASSSFPLAPPNHHQIQFTSHLDKFPFGPDTFTSVVFRFPAAAPESHFRNIISESRRVLKPGGYIELSVLDADLNSVGTRTRRAARRLKERVAAKHPEYNLGSTSDTMLRLLGRKGFTDIKTCRVGVPVASAVTGAQLGERPKKDERSLAEMMRDETEKGDENITKMVSKVGRWWYNRCYESSTGARSIWSDKAVLAECEQWGTSLKLMVCHARIPEGSGRHASL